MRLLSLTLVLSLSNAGLGWPWSESDEPRGAQRGHGGGQPMGSPFGFNRGQRSPFGDNMPIIEIEGEMPSMMIGVPQGVLMPVVMDGEFGFDPFEDLHRNMARKVMNKAQMPGPGGGGPHMLTLGGPQLVIGGGPQMMMGGGGGAVPIELELGSLLSMFAGDFEGQVGRAEGSFEVEDDHTSRIRISAMLPGYKLNGEDLAVSPLSVKVLGHRSVVVSGTQQMGPIIRSWQRSFSLPKGANTDKIAVTYQEKSGNLTVDVPRDNSTHNEREEEEEEEEDMDGLPPVLRAMAEGLPGLIGEMGRPRRRPDSGFLRPPRQRGGDDLLDILNSLGAMHPRNHAPHSQPVPEDAQVDFVGCFAESQISQAEKKYYGESNAAGFAGMYWHARADHAPYFAMARHDEPLGHALTMKSFAHDKEKPKWGLYDGCGAHCSDEPQRWCGCSNEDTRGFPSSACPGDHERHFAVYKITSSREGDQNVGADKIDEDDGDAPEREADSKASPPDGIAPVAPKASAEAQTPGAGASHAGRPYWQLAPNEGKSGPSIEVMVPKGMVPEAKGREILFFNASGKAEADSTGRTTEGTAGDSEASTTKEAAADAASAALGAASAGQQVGKVRLPVGVKPESCQFEAGRVTEDGNQVLRCALEKEDVKTVKIKVVEEL